MLCLSFRKIKTGGEKETFPPSSLLHEPLMATCHELLWGDLCSLWQSYVGQSELEGYFKAKFKGYLKAFFKQTTSARKKAGLPCQTPRQGAAGSSQADTVPEQTFLRESALHKRLQALAGISQGKSWARKGGAHPCAGQGPWPGPEHPSTYGSRRCFRNDATDLK